MENKNNVEIICDKFLPIEVINKILIMRPTHPIAKLIKPIIKEYRLDLIYRMSNGRTFDTYFFYWYYDAYPYKEEWNESDDFEDYNYNEEFSTRDCYSRYKEDDGLRYDGKKNVWYHIDNRNNRNNDSDSDSDSDSDTELNKRIKKFVGIYNDIYNSEDSDSEDSDSDSEDSDSDSDN